MQDKAYRSIIKTVSWRAVGTLDTVIISYLITGSLTMAASIGSIELFTKMLLYYFHERAWNRVNLGRHRPTGNDYQI